MARDSRDNRRGGGGRGKQNKVVKTMVVGPFRMAFPSLLEPELDDNGNERFKMIALFPPDYKGIRDIEDAMFEVMEADFGPESEWPSGRNDILPEDKLYDAGRKDYNGFKKGWWALSMSAKDQPGIIDADKNEVMSKREVYGGRWARAQISITTYDNKSKGVGVYMNHVQLLEHDEAFSGRGNAEDAFDRYEMDDKRGTGSRRGGRDNDREENDRRGSRSRDRDDREPSRGSRDDDRGSRRGRDDRDDDRGRGRDRDRDEDRRGSRDRDEDRSERRGGRDRDEDRGSRRRDADRDDRSEDRGSRRSSRDDDRDRSDRGSRRSSSDADEWN